MSVLVRPGQIWKSVMGTRWRVDSVEGEHCLVSRVDRPNDTYRWHHSSLTTTGMTMEVKLDLLPRELDIVRKLILLAQSHVRRPLAFDLKSLVAQDRITLKELTNIVEKFENDNIG